MTEPWLAHSENDEGCAHLLREHLQGVWLQIERLAGNTTHRKSLKLVALLHDFGKYQPAFQHYLKHGGARGSVPHARWGALLARSLQAEAVSFAIDGHHAGLPDYSVWANEHTFASNNVKQTLASLYADFKTDTGLQDNDICALCEKDTASQRIKDIRTRLLFSYLTDADWLDTEAHFSPKIATHRPQSRLNVHDAIEKVDSALQRIGAETSALNVLRTRTRMQALQKACLPVGFFALNLPTGLGKTLTSFRWALEHALLNGLERIIIVLPFTSIIDQTAATLAGILGQNAVLEHHSNYVPVSNDTEDISETNTHKKLACENWDYPIIVTTTVQFFETLFSNAPGKSRKLHSISQSVVILDEVQSLPKKMVLPTLDMLQDVQDVMRTSFVFCTATMPVFEARPEFPGIPTITVLVENVPELYDQTQRVRYSLLKALHPVDMADLEAAIRSQQTSTLVIANTKRTVRELYTSAMHWPEWDVVYHLSTSMCPHHRKAVIDAVRKDSTDAAKRILVISTQLVEAGVDLDFPRVFRELAPLESIIQAAGRCNREGRLAELGDVVLFQLAGSTFPDALYETQARHVLAMLSGSVEKLNQHSAFAAYYTQIMALFITPEPITSQREQQNFATVAAQYRLIKTPVCPVFVWDYNDDSKALYQLLRAKEQRKQPLSRMEFRAIQQYSVSIYESDMRKTRGAWEQSVLGVTIWNGGYSAQTGLDVTPALVDALIL